MSRALLLGAVLLAAPAAHAYESVCYQRADPTLDARAYPASGAPWCSPAAGPNTARQRWVGTLDEHRRLFETAAGLAGLPAAASDTLRLSVFTSAAPVDVGGAALASLVPVDFAAAGRVQTRAFSPGELAQLPDFSYALWDWATGHETCPAEVGGAGVDAVTCHDFASHMGPVNSNHFLPQAQGFYQRYHQLALGRAAACRAMRDAVAPASERLGHFARACEAQALALEAVAQHYLQDAWSTGHMWQRWGGAELGAFGGTGEAARDRAVLVALASGLIHGSRGVLQRLPEWTSYDVNDALCAPHAEVEYVLPGGARHAGVGDDYLHLLPTPGATAGGGALAPQAQRLYSCAAASLRAVYTAAGESHGALGALAGGLTPVDPTGPECFGQRATNRAMLKGAAVQFKVLGQQVDFELDARVVGWMVPKVARSTGEVPVAPRLRHAFRLGLQRVVSLARVLAKERPEGTELADGRLGAFLGAQPNGAYASALPAYVDPPLPWPATPDTSAPAQERARALARLFHRAHAADWCAATDAAGLEGLRARVAGLGAGDAARPAACGACVELVERHLRVGTGPGAYDAGREPVCHYLTGGPYVYASGAGGTAEVAQAWCGCP